MKCENFSFSKKLLFLLGNTRFTEVGKVTVKKSAAFDLTVGKVRLQNIPWKHCRVIHRFDGYIFARNVALMSSF